MKINECRTCGSDDTRILIDVSQHLKTPNIIISCCCCEQKYTIFNVDIYKISLGEIRNKAIEKWNEYNEETE